ncbi:SHOCT domain-containing protein [Microbacterium sp. NPDC057944]|uniref:SHOCT domain-containing protein n=1 Tax=Microbacterium sp. NPDC057944 TaxID=3346286 RepID=UPI0036D8E77F
MHFWSSIVDILWWSLTVFVFVAYLMALFSIISDLFRDRALNGFAKAVWLLFLVFLPFLTALVYLIARGKGMGERAAQQSAAAQSAAEDYVRSVAGTAATPTDEIERAKRLFDAGAISETEFASLKQSALRRASA